MAAIPNKPNIARPMIGSAFNAFAEHPGGCYTCRYFGRETNPDEVRCAKLGDEHVRSQASRGCAF